MLSNLVGSLQEMLSHSEKINLDPGFATNEGESSLLSGN